MACFNPRARDRAVVAVDPLAQAGAENRKRNPPARRATARTSFDAAAAPLARARKAGASQLTRPYSAVNSMRGSSGRWIAKYTAIPLRRSRRAPPPGPGSRDHALRKGNAAPFQRQIPSASPAAIGHQNLRVSTACGGNPRARDRAVVAVDPLSSSRRRKPKKKSAGAARHRPDQFRCRRGSARAREKSGSESVNAALFGSRFNERQQRPVDS